MRFIITILFLAISFCSVTKAAELKKPIIGVIVPMQEESKLFLKNINERKQLTVYGIKYQIGKISDKNIVFVNSGIGKVNATIIATRLINDFHPSFILLSGSSGNLNPELKEGSVVVGKNIADVDFGKLTANGIQFQYSQYLLNPQTNTNLPLVFHINTDLAKIISNLDKQLPNVKLGKIATSDALPNQPAQVKLLKASKFDVVESEGASVMQTCWMFKVPCIVVRGVSNNVEDTITAQDIEIAADNAAKVTMVIINNLAYDQ